VFVLLHLEHSLQPDRLATGWEIDEAPSVILIDGVHIFHHSLPPTQAALGLGERGRLIGAYHVQFLGHQCTRRELGHREDAAHAAEAELCVVVVVGIQVLIIDIIVHLRVTGSNRGW
jgi:hypothetical protein